MRRGDKKVITNTNLVRGTGTGFIGYWYWYWFLLATNFSLLDAGTGFFSTLIFPFWILVLVSLGHGYCFLLATGTATGTGFTVIPYCTGFTVTVTGFIGSWGVATGTGFTVIPYCTVILRNWFFLDANSDRLLYVISGSILRNWFFHIVLSQNPLLTFYKRVVSGIQRSLNRFFFVTGMLSFGENRPNWLVESCLLLVTGCAKEVNCLIVSLQGTFQNC
ncbi:uncharacterized protein LOC144557094 [Carex rostrata]